MTRLTMGVIRTVSDYACNGNQVRKNVFAVGSESVIRGGFDRGEF